MKTVVLTWTFQDPNVSFAKAFSSKMKKGDRGKKHNASTS